MPAQQYLHNSVVDDVAFLTSVRPLVVSEGDAPASWHSRRACSLDRPHDRFGSRLAPQEPPTTASPKSHAGPKTSRVLHNPLEILINVEGWRLPTHQKSHQTTGESFEFLTSPYFKAPKAIS